MVVRAAADQLVAAIHENGGQHLGIFDNLSGIGLESGTQCLAKGDSLGSDDMHQRSALDAGEDLAVDGLGHVFAGKDHAAAGAAQRLVRGRGGDVGIRNGGGMEACCHKACNVGHVDQKLGAYFVGDGAHAGKVDDARIGRGAAHDDLGMHFAGCFGQFVVVNKAVLAYAIGFDMEQAP